MCLRPEEIPIVPYQTARVAALAFPKGNLYMRLRDELGVLYQDENFVSLYPQKGQSAQAPWRLAMVLVMQFLENLSDRQAVEAVRGRIDWKYALSLELTDSGFDYSVLSEFRARLIQGNAEHKLLEQMLKRFQELKLLPTRGKQRTDSTHVLAVVRELSRLEHLGETLRAALNAIAVVAPTWLQSIAPNEWYDRYVKRFEDSRLPKTVAQRTALAETIGMDGFHLLDAIYTQTAPMELRKLAAVEILRCCWLQQYYAPTDNKVQLRNKSDGPPSALRIWSPYEDEARNSTKRTTKWTGYKVHLTESCDQDLPHIITHVETTPATTQDQAVVPEIHQALAEKDLLPEQHLVDRGYTSAELLTNSERDFQVDLFGPVSENVGWQAKAGLGFDLSHFQIDWQQKAAYCPQGKRSYLWKKNKDIYGKPIIYIEFRASDCRSCPVRSQCTRAKTNPRGLTIRRQQDYESLEKARTRQKTEQFQQQYALRSGIEGTLSQGIRAFGLRHCRYRGQAKTHLQHLLTAVAMNLVRVFAWFEEVPLAQTRCSRFALLAPSQPQSG